MVFDWQALGGGVLVAVVLGMLVGAAQRAWSIVDGGSGCFRGVRALKFGPHELRLGASEQEVNEVLGPTSACDYWSSIELADEAGANSGFRFPKVIGRCSESAGLVLGVAREWGSAIVAFDAARRVSCIKVGRK